MVEKALYNALGDYNKQITNTYSQNWGSLLNFMGKYTISKTLDVDDTQNIKAKTK